LNFTRGTDIPVTDRQTDRQTDRHDNYHTPTHAWASINNNGNLLNTEHISLENYFHIGNGMKNSTYNPIPSEMCSSIKNNSSFPPQEPGRVTAPSHHKNPVE